MTGLDTSQKVTDKAALDGTEAATAAPTPEPVPADGTRAAEAVAELAGVAQTPTESPAE